MPSLTQALQTVGKHQREELILQFITASAIAFVVVLLPMLFSNVLRYRRMKRRISRLDNPNSKGLLVLGCILAGLIFGGFGSGADRLIFDLRSIRRALKRFWLRVESSRVWDTLVDVQETWLRAVRSFMRIRNRLQGGRSGLIWR